MNNYALAKKIVDEIWRMQNSSEGYFYMEYVKRVEVLINKNSDTYPSPYTADTAEKSNCICTDFLHAKPDPVPNPDCPLHGAGFKTWNKSARELE